VIQLGVEGPHHAERRRIKDRDAKPVGRMFANGYARQNDRFDLTRESYADWAARRGE
jgi:hypothetical protein